MCVTASLFLKLTNHLVGFVDEQQVVLCAPLCRIVPPDVSSHCCLWNGWWWCWELISRHTSLRVWDGSHGDKLACLVSIPEARARHLTVHIVNRQQQQLDFFTPNTSINYFSWPQFEFDHFIFQYLLGLNSGFNGFCTQLNDANINEPWITVGRWQRGRFVWSTRQL